MTTSSIALMVGLGNPGSQYVRTRHNVGQYFVQQVARAIGTAFRFESKFSGDIASARIGSHTIWLFVPTTYMNESGRAVASVTRFYKLEPEQVLVVHDELELAPGVIRSKEGGGHGGHNGLRDVVQHLGSANFQRLRIGIGRPGSNKDVASYVLRKPSKEEAVKIETAMDAADRELPELIAGQSKININV